MEAPHTTIDEVVRFCHEGDGHAAFCQLSPEVRIWVAATIVERQARLSSAPTNTKSVLMQIFGVVAGSHLFALSHRYGAPFGEQGQTAALPKEFEVVLLEYDDWTPPGIGRLLKDLEKQKSETTC